MPETAKAAVAAALASEHDGPVLVVSATPSRALAMADELSAFVSGYPVARLPEREALPYEFARDEPAAAVERAWSLALLRGGGRCAVVASWNALAEHCAPPEDESEGLEIAVGQTLRPTSLMGQLEAAGYRVEALATEPGTASRRGGIIDVFPAGAERPMRIEFLGDEVESIRALDVATQRSAGRVDRVHVAPGSTSHRRAREGAQEVVARLEASSEAAEAVVEAFEVVAAGGRSDYQGFLEPLLYATTALDHLDGAALVVLDDAEEGFAALEALTAHEVRTRDELAGRGAIPSGLPAIHAAAAEVCRALAEWRPVELQRFGTEELGAARAPFTVTPGFAGKLRVLAQQVGAWAKQGRAVVLASQQALRLADLLDEEGVHADLRRVVTSPPQPGSVVLVPLAGNGGFTAGEWLTVVTDAEIFGFRKKRRPNRTRPGIRAGLVSTLEPGDYLVHADHGIGRYAGLVRRTIDGAEREYLELQYADDDRLFVPADQLEAITRYVGPTDHPPSLTRLSSQEWARAKRRVKQAVVELAQDLLELYAKRELARGHAFPADTAWQMEMEAAFPFVETDDQIGAIAEVKADMERGRPMDRLICGDVGYGKTEVAIRAAFKAVMDGKQVAVLVPTTVLAEQHGATFRERVAGFPVRVEVLSRFRSAARAARDRGGGRLGRRRYRDRDTPARAAGRCLSDLGLVIIDEEQRFGVSHKERLKQMRAEVDTSDALGHADPAHAADVARRHPRHEHRHDAAGGAAADPDVRHASGTTRSCARPSSASWSAAGRCTSSTTASRTSSGW